MPFTLSHPAAVLPLRRLGLPMSAMVTGSMVPDIPVFSADPSLYRFTHSALGIVTAAPAFTLVVLAVWSFLARDALVDLAPDPVRRRLAARARLTGRQWLLAPAGAALGALTHVGWDAFTHWNRWGVRQVSWLSAQHGPLPGYRWLQYGSSVLGLVILTAAVAVHLRAQPAGPRRPRRHPLAVAVLPAALAVAAAAGIAATLAYAPRGLHAAVFHGAVVSVTAIAASLTLVAGGWRITTRRPG
ncbi:hypothetical protein CC117_16250 [Parafrankia colletiae]|uniref:DUF4184 family protein n=1 Tax=Parafrankia colletiae TaxID=573497 RepID=A0A1S1QXR0_9ACTN|nr:DUF4184 family protein [Frankia sp. Cpl3]OHV38055.1 hypothetical protein CC117_16250 [Parafrankia colletiae]